MGKYKRRKKKTLSLKKKKAKKMLRNSEWVLLGILCVAISELIVNYYGLSWKYLSYTFAVCSVIIFRVFLLFIKLFTKSANVFLDRINNV